MKKKKLSSRSRPDIELPPEDEKAVRRGFFRRNDLERLCGALDPKTSRPILPAPLADVVTFLFFCQWRVGAIRRIEWRDYNDADRALTLRPELNKGHQLQIPVDHESTPELAAVISRQRGRRRAGCPFVFHGGRSCGTVRIDKKRNRRPCLGDFQKVWDRACAAIGLAGRIPHDLRR